MELDQFHFLQPLFERIICIIKKERDNFCYDFWPGQNAQICFAKLIISIGSLAYMQEISNESE